jgi:hypothetical protein
MRSVLAVLVAAAFAGALFAATVAEASCIFLTPAEKRARAHVIFDGVALEGPTATGVQRFRVTRYLKGAGPRIVRVQTGTIQRADGTGSTTSVALLVERGERWRIFARGSPSRVLKTSVCDGSRRR